MSHDEIDPLDIAVIGMAGRFPGAPNVAAYWENLQGGVESLKRLSAEELRAAGVDPAISGQPSYIPVAANLDQIDRFDAAFFGYSPREAEMLDPQSRLFLECAWEALESAGWTGPRGETRVGVFASSAISGYLLLHLAPSLDLANATMPVDFVKAHTANDKDFIATRVAYKLDLRGPAVTVQTACSSSLVAIHLARQSLLTQECDMALAGGVALHLPQGIGYVYDEDYVLSADGHTRTFDANATGAVFGDGAGVVVLKRLADAVRDRDPILAIVKGSAINNDGDRKVGYTAPSLTGLVEVVTEALGNAGVDVDTIGYVEAHGTATLQGDPIEVAALSQAFRAQTEGVGFCGVGSVKTNIGHLEQAAGVASFIKAVLMVKEGWLVPSLHYETPNPRVPLEGSPFFVTTARRPWRSNGPRRAGVNALGVGGTNAHVIVQEPPRVAPAPTAEPRPQLLCLSAKSPAALRELASRYERFLDGTKAPWADVCFTTQLRRAHFTERLTVVASSPEAARTQLASFATSGAVDDRTRAARGTARADSGSPVFVFSGHGGHWAGMGRDLLGSDPVFRDALHRCDGVIRALADGSVVDVLEGRGPAAALERADIVQPLVFAIQVALAERFRAWGIVPGAVVGHSMGEIAAAHVAGALSLEDATRVICARSLLLHQSPPVGAMVLVELSEADARAAVEGAPDISVASQNGPRTAVLSGARVALEPVFQRLQERGVYCRWVRGADRAGHSPIMDPMLPKLGERLASLRPQATSIPFYSTVMGEPVDGVQLDARYWQRNLRLQVRFWAAFERLIADGHRVFLELNGHPLLLPPLTGLDADETAGVPLSLVSSLRRDSEGASDLLHAVGQLHVAGCAVDFARVEPGERQAVTLPTYAFQRERFWIDPPALARVARGPSSDGWFHEVAWRPSATPEASGREPGRWLIFADRGGVGTVIAEQLVRRGASVEVVFAMDGVESPQPGYIRIDPERPEAIASEIRARAADGGLRGVVHLWSLDALPDAADPELDALQAAHARALGTALGAIQGLDESSGTALWLVTRGAQAVGTARRIARIAIAQAPIWGLGRALGEEQPERRVTMVDLDPDTDDAARLVDDLLSDASERQIAYRGGERLLARLARVSVEAPADASLPANATYLVTGGLGGIGFGTAQWLAQRGARHLVLCGRSAPKDTVLAAITALERAGVTVKVARCDVANRAAVAALVAEIGATMPPLRGVFHSAAVLDDAVLERLTFPNFRRVFAPKADGAWNLHLETRGLALDHFVLYSSIAALLPPVGTANYAAANAFLDALAQHRQALGLPGTSINWGAWGDLGLAAKRGMLEGFADNGVLTMDPEAAYDAMRRVLAKGPAHVLVAKLDGDRVARDSVFASELATGAKLQATGASGADSARARILAAPSAERAARLTSWLQQCVAGILRIAPDQLPTDRPINSLGMDSLMAVELRNRSKSELGIVLKLGELFRGATIADLCARLLPQLDDATPPAHAPQPTSAVAAKPGPAAKPAPAPPPPRPAEQAADVSERAADGWLLVQRPNPRAEMRLICFPYAGGGAAVFTGWSALLPPWLEVCAVELPGRGNRLHEPPMESFEEVVDALVAALAPYLDRPFAMFGHCLGAMFMHYVAQRLEAEHGLRPVQLFASGAGSPDIYMAVDTSTVESSAVLGLLEEINFANAKVLLEDEEARNLLLPGVMADFRLTAKYRYKPGKRYDQPLMTFAGFDDVFTPPKQMEGWRDFTTGPFCSFVYAGGHYFIEKERASILRIVSQELMVHHSRALRRDPARWFAHAPGSPVRREAAKSRLFCLGYAGGSTRTFATWPERLPGVDVVPIELPGRGARADELPLHRVEDIAAELRTAIEPYLDLPYAIVGHDLGALVAYELACARSARGRRPTHLFVSSEQAPHRRRPASLQYLDDAQFASTLAGYKFPRAGEQWGPEDWRMLRADFAARSEYARPIGERLDVPIHVIRADGDMMVNPAGVEGWCDVSRAEVTLHTCPGSHYHIDDPRSFVVGVVAAALRAN